METFELYLSPRNEKQFKAIVTQSGEGDSSLPFTDSKNDWRMTLLRTLELAGFNPQYFSSHEQEWMKSAGILTEDGKDFDTNYLVYIGQALYRSLFPEGKVENAFKAALRLAESKNTQLHIQLRFEDDSSKRSRLADYPWELLHDGQDFLLHHQVTFSRYIAHDALPPNLSTFEQLNVLLVSSAAFDKELGLQKLSKKEQQAIYKGLESAHDAGHINLDELDYATIDELRKYFTEHQGKNAPHVVHFDGHGIFAKRCKNGNCHTIHKRISATHCNKCNSELPKAQGYLAFESEGNKPDYVSAKELGALLQQTSFADGSQKPGGVALVVLSACQSAMALEGESVFNGAAQNLINHRIPAVVAMQYSVNVDAATEFAKQFYRSLGQKNSLAVAISQGREAMGVEGNQWYRPVLYLRWQDNEGGQLFTLPKSTGHLSIPFQAPPLSTYYVDRPEYSQDLKKRLLTQSSDVRTLVVTAIHGLGSIGKSTLATALAHDQDVQNHFCDGILWVTLGQKPNLLPLLSVWVQALGDYNFKATSVEGASNQLRTLLHDKAVLLVVDDAWNTEDARAFKVGGARCQVLVTTREEGIAEVLGASTFSLDVMQPSQAMELLTKKLGRKLGETETQSAEALAKALGYLPLALDLAAAQVDCGIAWKVLLQDMQQEVARFKTLDDPLARDANDEASLKRLSLTASLNLSIKERLPGQKRGLSRQERENFIWLGILPEDVNITQKMIATLWDIDDERDAADELRYFQKKALLLPGVPLMDGTPTYRLHDLFHDLARNLLTAPTNPKRRGNLAGLGITLPVAHATFLEKYRNLTHKKLWHTLPSDGYIHQHLVWHLEKAEKIEEIHKLLAEESETGGNGWYEACDRLGQTANFVTDVARAWELAEASWTETTLPQVVGLQCRYALMITSLNSLTANIPIELLIALVQKNVWTPEQALAYIEQSSNPENKVSLLTQLVNHLPPNFKTLAFSKALAVARGIQDEKKRAKVLFILAEELPVDFLRDVEAEARKIQDEVLRGFILIFLVSKLPKLLPEAQAFLQKILQYQEECAEVLILLAPELSPELLIEVLPAARQVKNKEKRAEVLILLAPKLPELLPEAVAAIREIKNEEKRADTLSKLAEGLTPELLTEVLVAAIRTAIRKIQDEEKRADILSKLAEKLPELLPEVLAAAKEIPDESNRAYALFKLADKLPELYPEVLAAAKKIPDESDRAIFLRDLAKELPLELLPEALATAREIQDRYRRADALIGLVKVMPKLLSEALAAAKEVPDDSHRADALRFLANEVPELLPEALAAAREIKEKSSRADALKYLALKVPELLPEALAAVREIRNERRHISLKTLAPKLPRELLPEALTIVMEIRDDWQRANTLNTLADKLPELLPEALAAARKIPNQFLCAYLLITLAPKMPLELLPEVLAAAIEIRCNDLEGDVLLDLASKLPGELLAEVLAAASKIHSEYDSAYTIKLSILEGFNGVATNGSNQIRDEYPRAYFLSILAAKERKWLSEALSAIGEIWEAYDRVEALSILADQLPELLPEALDITKEIENEPNRALALSKLAPKLPPQLLPGALNIARKIHHESTRALALSKLAPKLPPQLLPEALTIAREIHDESNRALVLSKLAPKLTPELLPEALTIAREIHDESNRTLVLSSLANKLPNLLPEVLAAARKIKEELTRVLALSNLAEKLPELLLEALAVARGIKSEKERAEALGTLAEKLSQIQKTQLFYIWRDTLYILSLRTRPDLLTDIQAFTPVIFSLGGQQAVKNTASAIQDVSRWWG